MKDKTLSRTTGIVQVEYLRTEMLLALKSTYPDGLNIPELRATLEDWRSTESSIDELRVEASYLAEKLLVRAKEAKNAPEYNRFYITARGIDFLNGHVQEVGLGSPEVLS